VKLTEAQRGELEAAARRENLSISEYIRRRALTATGGAPAVTPAVESLPSHHVDELGPDTLRADNGALTR